MSRILDVGWPGQVDAQSILDCMGAGSGGVPAVTRAYHDGLIRSVEASFEVMDVMPRLFSFACRELLACVGCGNGSFKGNALRQQQLVLFQGKTKRRIRRTQVKHAAGCSSPLSKRHIAFRLKQRRRVFQVHFQLCSASQFLLDAGHAHGISACCFRSCKSRLFVPCCHLYCSTVLPVAEELNKP